MAPEPAPTAPAVVAVIVTCDPGTWFEEVLESFAAQDYPNLSVLVVDSASTVDPTPLVSEVLPGAFVRRLERRAGFGTAANEVLGAVDGASHYLFCHDDVVLAPDAVRLLVEEAYRSNAGVTSPKFVMWDDPARLLAVGSTTDKVGAARNVVEPGELDQAQHDAVRDVLVAPGGATLVRADLFEELGGFSPLVEQYGEDVDFSWRARLAGARLTVVPAARVRHLEATRNQARPVRQAPGAARRASRRQHVNRLRTMLTCYRWFTLIWAVPVAVLWALGEAATLTVQGRAGDGWVAVSALGGALRSPAKLWACRRKVQRNRRVGDSHLRALQAPGNSRLRQFLESRFDGSVPGPATRPRSADSPVLSFGGAEAPDDAGVPSATARPDGGADGAPKPVVPTPARRQGGWRGQALCGVLLLFLLVLGTRSLLGAQLPVVGTLPDTSLGWTGIWREWWSAWQPVGLGVAAPSSPAMAMLGVIGTVLFGAMGTLKHVVVLGPLLIGPLGAYRSARHWGSRWGQLAAAAFYAVTPLSYNALALGHWGGLVAYGAFPWIFGSLIRVSGEIPLPAPLRGTVAPRVVGAGLLVALAASVAPGVLYEVPLAGAALLVGSLLAGRLRGGSRMAGASLGAAAVALVLLMPWSGTVVGSSTAVIGPDRGPAGRFGLGQVLRFHTGPFGSGGWEWLLLVAAALPLLVGREWRLEWASRLWTVALTFFFVTWAGSRGWVPALPTEVALAPAAAALAGCAALGAASFELDLPGYRFGWRQVAAAVAGASLTLAAVPFVAALGGGRWDLPSADAASVLTFLPNPHGGDYRVLWAGSPDALPLAGLPLEKGFAYGTTFDGPTTLADDWAPGSPGASGELAGDLHLVERGLTTKLGHLLAPAGVLYLVVPNHSGPSGSKSAAVPVPSALLAGMALQTDMYPVDVGDPHYSVYRNAAWAPGRSVLPTSAAAASHAGLLAGRRLAQGTDLHGAVPVMTGGHEAGVDGRVVPGTDVFVSATYSAGWTLGVAGRQVRPTRAFGWAMSFSVPRLDASASTEPAHLGYGAPLVVRGGDVLQLVLWVGAAAMVAAGARRRARRRTTEVVDPSWFEPKGAPSPRHRRARTAPAADDLGPLSGDEVWSDV
ncbi:MAG TPA: glycosyltransferase [Acidimicrobiales bacterium]|nr:glycosyltransferase [Acidimicrobiales bacterium]